MSKPASFILAELRRMNVTLDAETEKTVAFLAAVAEDPLAVPSSRQKARTALAKLHAAAVAASSPKTATATAV